MAVYKQLMQGMIFHKERYTMSQVHELVNGETLIHANFMNIYFLIYLYFVNRWPNHPLLQVVQEDNGIKYHTTTSRNDGNDISTIEIEKTYLLEFLLTNFHERDLFIKYTLASRRSMKHAYLNIKGVPVLDAVMKTLDINQIRKGSYLSVFVDSKIHSFENTVFNENSVRQSIIERTGSTQNLSEISTGVRNFLRRAMLHGYSVNSINDILAINYFERDEFLSNSVQVGLRKDSYFNLMLESLGNIIGVRNDETLDMFLDKLMSRHSEIKKSYSRDTREEVVVDYLNQKMNQTARYDFFNHKNEKFFFVGDYDKIIDSLYTSRYFSSPDYSNLSEEMFYDKLAIESKSKYEEIKIQTMYNNRKISRILDLEKLNIKNPTKMIPALV